MDDADDEDGGGGGGDTAAATFGVLRYRCALAVYDGGSRPKYLWYWCRWPRANLASTYSWRLTAGSWSGYTTKSTSDRSCCLYCSSCRSNRLGRGGGGGGGGCRACSSGGATEATVG